MNIVIATPLYPPDIAEPAPYVKELAKRLKSGTNYGVTVVTYGRLPEKIAGVDIQTVSKQQPLAFRIIAFTRALARAAKNADVIYAQNGASVELPCAVVCLIMHRKLIFRISDKAAHEHAQKSWIYGMIESFAKKQSRAILQNELPLKPEIISFEPYPTEALETYTRAWKDHVHELQKLFDTHA